jgi:multicomponent Na+:H+ antiporter subunit D
MTGGVASVALPLLVGLPLLAAGGLVAVAAHRRAVLARTVLFGVLIANSTVGVLLVAARTDGSVLAHQVGNWLPGVAIVFVADMFAALMLAATGLLTLTCCAFAVAAGQEQRRMFAPLVLVLTGGVNGALLTGDLFNLFVFIEVMLLPSYGLRMLASRGTDSERQVRGNRLYVTVNLLTSTIFLAGVGLIYGVTGTVNLGELAGAARDSGTVAAAAAVCLFALSIKAAVVPVHGWLAQAYSATSPTIAALFSGLHTKVAIYAIYRIYAVVFDGDSRWLWVGIVLFSVTMVVGGLGAVGQNTARAVLAFSTVSQVGYILLGVALFGPLGLTAGIFYQLHHMIVKTSLFLSAGAVEVRYGSVPLGQVRGLARREPVIAVAFFAAALSLAGLPPFSGFVAKYALVTASFSTGQWVAGAVAVLASLLTMLAMLKIWSSTFWGKPDQDDDPPAGAADVDHTSGDTAVGDTAVAVRTPPRIGTALAAPAIALVLATLAFGLGGELMMWLASVAADGLVDTTSYVQAVLTP